jgi:hypothetical protein
MYDVGVISGGTIYEALEEYEGHCFNNLRSCCTSITDERNLSHMPLT